MLVIGHRGAAGLAPENTLEALRAGLQAGADMLEFDIRLTKDGIPVLLHDPILLRTHGNRAAVARCTLSELREHTRHQPIATLEEVLDEFLGVVLLNIELKSRGSGEAVVKLISERYVTSPQDWDKVLFSSFHSRELRSIRRHSKVAKLALLHHYNPFLFIAHHRQLQLSAVGFHCFYVSNLALEIARRIGLFTYVYTVDRPQMARVFLRKHLDGIVTNHPDIIGAALNKSKI